MRVLFFVGTLDAGGLERFVTRIALKAQETGFFEPVILCMYRRQGIFLPLLEKVQIPVFEAPEAWPRRLGALIKLSGLIRQVSPDIVHSQGNFSLFQQFLAVRLASRAVFCVTERNQYPLAGFALLRRYIQFHGLRWLGGHYSANSHAVAKYLASQVNYSVNKIPVLENGVTLIPPDETIRNEYRAKLGWDPNTIGLGYIARMASHKGQEIFLRVLSSLTTGGLSVKGCLVGDGPNRQALERLVKQLNLEQVVTMVGIVPNVEDYLRAFDIVALLSEHEGMPNAVLEAMAAEKAVVATGVGAIPELLDWGRAGIVIQESTQENLTRELRLLIQDKNLRENLGQHATKRVAELFGLDRILKKLVDYYQEVLD
jgi:glycosyltransferase involved in cell wall biosynthesis